MSQELILKCLKMDISRRPFDRPSVCAILSGQCLYTFSLYLLTINKNVVF